MRATVAFILSFTLLTQYSPAQHSSTQQIRLPTTQDNSIVLNDGEWKQNAGQQARIRAKGNQHIIAMAFDTTAIRGKCIQRATLVCTPSEQKIQGVTISTIATRWDENRSNGLTAGIDDIVDWGYPQSRFPAVCGGNAFTLVSHAMSRLEEDRYHWDISPDLVHALSTGIAHGLAIHEHDADYGRNPTIYSREQSGKAPYLLVELDEGRDAMPEPPTDLQIVELASGARALTLQSPKSGFAYEVTVNGVALGRHNIPIVQPGQKQQIPLRDLPALQLETEQSPEQSLERTLDIQVVTLNRQGDRSKPVVLTTSLKAAPTIAAPQVQFVAAAPQPLPDIAVLPLCDTFDQAGNAVGTLQPSQRTHNSIYDGQTIRLNAAAGEVVGFQLLLRGTQPVNVALKSDSLPARVDLWQGVVVPANGRQIVDPLVPLSKSLELRKDRDEVVVADIYIPFDQPAGKHQASVTLSDGRKVPIELTVLPFALPREATFVCEMNSYGLPDEAKDYYELQRIAYDHRVHVNILHYSHNTAAPGSRKSNLDMRLASGKRMDNKRYNDVEPGATTAYWDDFREAFGPLLDGSYFRQGHRGSVAVPGFYLTFHESWPLHCRQYFNGSPDAFKAFDDPAYANTYVQVLKSFASLAAQQGWNESGMQVYFNNKGSLNDKAKAPWILDEPSSYWDYHALRYYGELTDKATGGADRSGVRYRIDISRPEFSRSELEGRSDLWVVSSSAFQNYRRLVTDRIDRDGLIAWVYGTANHVHEPNRNLQAWALDAWCDGATGLVPWQTINKSGSAMKEADQLGLFIFDIDSSGQAVIRHSLRLKAFREAQQLIEYLALLKKKMRWTDSQMKSFVANYVKLQAEVAKLNEDDAGTTNYANITSTDLDRLRHATATLLMR